MTDFEKRVQVLENRLAGFKRWAKIFVGVGIGCFIAGNAIADAASPQAAVIVASGGMGCFLLGALCLVGAVVTYFTPAD